MAHAYTPGLKVTNRMPHSAVRMLPIKGEVMVSVGDTVNANKIVAATYMPGDVYPLNMANLLAVPPKDVMGLMIHKEGKKVEVFISVIVSHLIAILKPRLFNSVTFVPLINYDFVN